MRNPINGQYAHKKRGKIQSYLFILKLAALSSGVGFLVWAIATGNTNGLATTQPVVETVVEVKDLGAQEDERYKEFMNREEVKKAHELNAKIGVIEEDLEAERKAKLEADAKLDEEYAEDKKKLKEEHAKRLLRLNGNLDTLQKEKLQLVASSTKTSFRNTQVITLRHFLEKRNPEMAKYAHMIVDLPRYMEVVMITGQESTWCTSNMAKEKKNCGGVKNKNAQGFKVYPNIYESLKDMAKLLDRPIYKDKTIAEMNGTYCVHEESPSGRGKCPNWTENITRNIVAFRKDLLSRI